MTRQLTFDERDFKGSRLRCLLATNQKREDVSAFFEAIATPDSRVLPDDREWSPRGFLDKQEVRLGRTEGFVDAHHDAIINWWLANGGNTPNWDLVCNCRIENREALILVEAKAHEGEFDGKSDACGSVDLMNKQRIEIAMAEANAEWNQLQPGFDLRTNAWYQLSNRFAFAWKLAQLGVPVTLVYLGFLDAWEMDNGTRTLLSSHNQWRDCVIRQSKGVVPDNAWNQTHSVNGTPLTVLIRSAKVDIVVGQ
jgi:hypothetical protein